MLDLVIAGVPRTRTAWLAAYLSNPNFVVAHELSTYHPDSRGLYNAAAGPDWLMSNIRYCERFSMWEQTQRCLNRYVPVVSILPSADTTAAYRRFLTQNLPNSPQDEIDAFVDETMDECTTNLHKLVEMGGEKKRYKFKVINYEDLNDFMVMRDLVRWIRENMTIPQRPIMQSMEWHEHMVSLNVQMQAQHTMPRAEFANASWQRNLG